MKRLYILLLASAFVIMAKAQYTPLSKYDIAATEYEELFLDHVGSFMYSDIDRGETRCISQMDDSGKMYGYGTYTNASGSQIIGKFRKGDPMFTITLGQHYAIVGSPNFHCTYSLTTGHLESISKGLSKTSVADSTAEQYLFMRQRYENKDEYIGEMYQGQRHGFGIYYYRNGDYWFGQWNYGFRSGYGCFFSSKKGMSIGRWEGDDSRREISIKKR